LYQEWKLYWPQPRVSQQARLEARFEALCAGRTGSPSVDGVLKEMAAPPTDRLRVLERSKVPLHHPVSERRLREYVTQRKIGGSTRRASGFLLVN